MIPFSLSKEDSTSLMQKLGKERLIEALDLMVKIRNFEVRAESAYQQGHIGGFFHAYIGQEAIQTAAIMALGRDHWFTTTYRCHALALLLGVTPNEAMAELYGKASGNAMGRGGSMHLFHERMLGGHGIVGGHIPIATGSAFSLKYQEDRSKIALCFMGDGAVAQGAFHESLNLAALWDLPILYVIENNQWGMGTAVDRALSVSKLAESKGPSYGIEASTIDGMDFFSCYNGFEKLYQKIKEEQRPHIVEVITERFRGHSISDPGLYRSKDALKECQKKDPILLLKNRLVESGHLSEELFKEMDKKRRDEMVSAMQFAEKSPWPELSTLEEDVFAP